MVWDLVRLYHCTLGLDHGRGYNVYGGLEVVWWLINPPRDRPNISKATIFSSR